MSGRHIAAAMQLGQGRFRPPAPLAPEVDLVLVSPAPFTVTVGYIRQLTATAYDVNGIVMPNETFAWESSNEAVATVTQSGTVRGISAGTVTITATASGIDGTSGGTVAAAGTYSPLDSPSTVVYNPEPHPWVWTNAPEMPREYFDTRYDPGGTALTWTIDKTLTNLNNRDANLNQLQQEIDAWAGTAGHGRLKLPSNYLCWNPIFRKNVRGAYWLYIEWASLGVAEGTRVSPATMAGAPEFYARGANTYGAPHAFQLDRAANRIRLVGIACRCADGVSIYDLVWTEAKESSVEYGYNVADMTDWIILDRILVEGNDTGNGTYHTVRNGVTHNAMHAALIDSYVHQIGWEAAGGGSEGHGVIWWNSPGPVKIVNNYMEATDTCFFVGGSRPNLGVTVGRPCDAEVRRNQMSRRLSWCKTDPSWDGCFRGVKNSMETKNCIRVLFEGNVVERSWPDGQAGMLCVIKSGEGTAGIPDPGAGQGTEDLTLRYNIWRESSIAWNFQGHDDAFSIPLNRVAHYHNLAYRIGEFDGRRFSFELTHDPKDLYLRHNTCVLSTTPVDVLALFNTGGAQRLTLSDNLIGVSYIYEQSGAYGTAALNAWCSGWVFERNLLVGYYVDHMAISPPTTMRVDSYGGVGFVDAGARNYRLAESSPFKGTGDNGTDPGCDMDKVELATSGVAP